MARKYSMGYFADGNGAMEGVEYSQDFADVQARLEADSENMLDFAEDLVDHLENLEENLLGILQENQFVLKEISRQLDVLTELVGELGEKNDHQ